MCNEIQYVDDRCVRIHDERTAACHCQTETLMDLDNRTPCTDNLHSRHDHWRCRDHTDHENQQSTDSQRNSRPKNKISQRRADITHQSRRHAGTKPAATNSVSRISHRRVSEAFTSSKVAQVHFVRMLRTRRVTLVTPLGSAGMARTKKRYKDGERSEEEVILIKGRHLSLVRGKDWEKRSCSVRRARRGRRGQRSGEADCKKPKKMPGLARGQRPVETRREW